MSKFRPLLLFQNVCVAKRLFEAAFPLLSVQAVIFILYLKIFFLRFCNHSVGKKCNAQVIFIIFLFNVPDVCSDHELTTHKS